MIQNIEPMIKIDWTQLVIAVFIVLVGIRAATELIKWFIESLGIETKWTKRKREEHELLVSVTENLKRLEENLKKLEEKERRDKENADKYHDVLQSNMELLTDKIDGLSTSLNEMRTGNDEDIRAELKDKISRSYVFFKQRKYSEERPYPYWTDMEKESLEGLIAQYEAHGGLNSFVHSDVQPDSSKFILISKEEFEQRLKD